MLFLKQFNITKTERGLMYRDREFVAVLKPGKQTIFDPLNKVKVEVVSVLGPMLQRADAEVIAKSGLLGAEALIVDLKDKERGLVYVDGRFSMIVGAGVHVFWTVEKNVTVEKAEITETRFVHRDLQVIVKSPGTSAFLEASQVEFGATGLYFREGQFVEALAPGNYAFWKGAARTQVKMVDLREVVLDVVGQEILTADRVTLRVNANVAYQVADPLKSVTRSADAGQAFYREAQLALRAVIGTRDLDSILAEKDVVVAELTALVLSRADELGLKLTGFGLRDLILPGDMKTLLNKVVEAKKIAEAALITRREETASIRSQANTAKIFETNPTLMKLRELETLERITQKATLNVVLGDGNITDRVMKLI